MKKLLYIIVLFVSLFLTTSCGRKYTISYYVNGELFAVEEYKAKSDIKLISDVQEVGYKFNYWILDNGTKFTETKMPKQNINLYGSFTPNTWKVMFYDDDKLLHHGKIIADKNLEWRERVVYMMNQVAILIKKYIVVMILMIIL